ncbi:hypothetical protein JMJ35_004856 [Cladonia borealis]|uniref:3-carboxymuconate cyclase n=1 Tax=Cladonia borealis TaxID=184061 RepID=A0AA39R3A4_9LECA|nr:hypothetical protein JMJ35_004856 [Cladonia borealis]
MRSSQLLRLITVNIGIAYSFAVSYPRDDSFYGQNRAAYFQDNDSAGNSLVALQISEYDGTLSNPVKISTGGKGLAGLVAVSQDSVVVDGNYIFTINAGDNTFSLFIIDGRDPTHPKLVGNALPTLGQTPVSVTYSDKLKTACALNSGSTAGITCFKISTHGPTPQGGLRFIPQTELNDSSAPPPGPLVLSADISFNPTSTALFATVRSNGALPGLLYTYPISPSGQISVTPIVTSLPSLPFLFSLNFLDNNPSHLFVTNPHQFSPGAAFLNIEYPSLKASVEKIITIPGQIASCWVAYAPQLDAVYIIDAARPNVVTISPETGEVTGQTSFPANNLVESGGADARVDRNWLYILSDDQMDPKVIIMEVGPEQVPTTVQEFDIFQQVGTIPGLMGMAIYPTEY